MSRPGAIAVQGELWPGGRVALIGCSATKLSEAAPAEELYCGALFKLAREWVALRRDVYVHWGILSAAHGLVLPEAELEPYDANLGAMSLEERNAWGRQTSQAIVAQWGGHRIYTVLAGREYVSPLDLPYLEDLYGHWRDQYVARHPRRRWGIGCMKSRLAAENRRLRWALEPCECGAECTCVVPDGFEAEHRDGSDRRAGRCV